MLPWRLPTPLAREAVVRDGRGVIVAGGLVAGDASTAAAYRLDLTTGRTRRLPDLSVPVHDTGGGTTSGRPTILGGGNSAEQDAVQRLAGGGWRIVGRLPTARSDLSTVTFQGRLLVIGGYDGVSTALPDVLSTSSGSAFAVVGKLKVAVRYAAVAAARGAIWVFGGERDGVPVDLVQRLDPTSGRCRVVAHLPRPLGEAVAVVMDGQVLLVGGRTSSGSPTGSMTWFDPRTHRFRAAGRLPTPLADSAVVVAGRSAYLIGGETPALSDRVVRLSFAG